MKLQIAVAIALFGFASFASSSPIVVDGNGRFVGFYQGLGIGGTESAVSSTGYRFGFERTSGKIAPTQDLGTSFWSVFFTSTDCTGQAYVESAGRVAGFIAIPDYDVLAALDPPVFALPQVMPAAVTVQRRSTWNYQGNSLSCYIDATPTSLEALPVQTNDPAETGIPGARFQPPLRVISSWLFRDGFEQPLTLSRSRVLKKSEALSRRSTYVNSAQRTDQQDAYFSRTRPKIDSFHTDSAGSISTQGFCGILVGVRCVSGCLLSLREDA